MKLTPGPASIEGTSWMGRMPLGDRWNRREFLVNLHRERIDRIEEITEIANGNWWVVWPDLSRTPEAPSVANIIELGIAHWSSIGGAMLPSVRVPVSITQDRSQAKRGARKRERRLRELWRESNTAAISGLLWGDYAGTGSAYLGVWVNFEEEDPAKRNPYFVRFDPRHCYPMLDNMGEITELLVARKISKVELRAMLPEEWQGVFEEADAEDIEEWFWFEKDRFFYALVDVSKDGRAVDRNLVLVDEPNPLGFVPVAEAARPTFDGQRRGVFDQAAHLLRTMHRLMTMTIHSTEQHSYPATVEFDAANPGDFGPGADIHLRSGDGKFEVVQPPSHFDVKDLIARMAEDARMAAVFPQQLTGEPGASITSARGIKASMGALDARLSVAHKQFEILFGKASGFMLAMDEHFCDGEKLISGDARDTKPGERYLPSRDVNGNYEAVATYGFAAGSDPANLEMRLGMHRASGLISRQTAREQLPFLQEDPDAEEVLLLREMSRDALAAGVMARAQQQDLQPVAKLLELMQTDDVDIDNVINQMVEFLQNPNPEQGLGGPGMGMGGMPGGAGEFAQGAESLARGGIPGNAAQSPEVAGAGLPPLAQIMGQDSRQVS